MYRDSVTPQSLMLNFLGLYVFGRDTAVYSGSVIDVFGRVDVSEEAVRSTLTRMTSRGLLAKTEAGRRARVDPENDTTGVGNDRVARQGHIHDVAIRRRCCARSRLVLAGVTDHDIGQNLRIVERGITPFHGLLRVTAPVQFGRRHVAPVITSFLDAFSEIQVELVLSRPAA